MPDHVVKTHSKKYPQCERMNSFLIFFSALVVSEAMYALTHDILLLHGSQVNGLLGKGLDVLGMEKKDFG